MAENSKIEWTTHTFNPWHGCSEDSPGCANCYAKKMAMRNPTVLGVWGKNGTRPIAAESAWKQPFRWDRAAAVKGERHRVFCASISDIFEGPDTMPAEHWRRVSMARARLMNEVIPQTPNLDWLLLTKRPQNCINAEKGFIPASWKLAFPKNVWIGTSVENQKYADERIPHLLRVPAAVRFLSCEPLLGPVTIPEEYLRGGETIHISMSVSGALRNKDLDCFDHKDGRRMTRAEAEAELLRLQSQGVKVIPCGECDGFSTETGCPWHREPRIDWVIVGGESGPKARPMHWKWAHSLRDQCDNAGVPFFFKQWGEWVSGVKTQSDIEEGASQFRPGCYHDFGDESMALKIGKKSSGRLLDGREWNEFPTVPAL